MKRQQLLDQMAVLSTREIDCRACRGECCTFKSNSMQITVEEARDILDDLCSRGILNEALKEKIRASIREFRLDVEIPAFGSRPNLRRTYTCPLYEPGPKGCLVRAEKKPLGCLAFNAIVSGASGLHSGCRSDQELLAKCVDPASVAEKAPIPVALWRILQEEETAPADFQG